MLDDLPSSPVSEKLKALLTLVAKTAKQSVAVTRDDVDAVRAAGWPDEAIYDALTVCALFRFYNTWIDATGVSGLPDYAMSAERLARDGYIPREPQKGAEP